MSAKRVVIVEDEPALAALLSEVLGDSGFATEIHTSPVAALDAIALEPPDVLLFDWRMGELEGLNGARFYEQVREAGVTCPAILCTAMTNGAELAADMGVGYIAKPFDIDDLVAKVSRAAA